MKKDDMSIYKNTLYTNCMDNGVGIDDKKNEHIVIFPNPTTDFFMVKMNSPNSIRINIFNSNGLLILAKDISSEKIIGIEHLPPDIYIVRIKEDEKYFTIKLDKQ